jgi:hypothetical protein
MTITTAAAQQQQQQQQKLKPMTGHLKDGEWFSHKNQTTCQYSRASESSSAENQLNEKL